MNDILILCLQLASAAAASISGSGLPVLLPAGLMANPVCFLRLPDAADRLCASLCRLSAFCPAGGPVPAAAHALILALFPLSASAFVRICAAGAFLLRHIFLILILYAGC